MKSITDFIIHIPKPFNETFTTEQGLKLFGDKRWLAQKMANCKAKVVSAPIGIETPIKEGFDVMVDPTIFYEQIYVLTHGEQESIHLVDKEKMLYKVQPNLVVIYRENENDTWKGNMTNAIFERVEIEEKEVKLQSSLIIIPEANTTKKRYHNNQAKLVYGNSELDVLPGEKTMVKEDFGLPFDIEGKLYLWFRNEDVIAVLN